MCHPDKLLRHRAAPPVCGVMPGPKEPSAYMKFVEKHRALLVCIGVLPTRDEEDRDDADDALGMDTDLLEEALMEAGLDADLDEDGVPDA